MIHLSTSSHVAICTIAIFWSVSCFPEGYDRCGDGYQYQENGSCFKLDEDASSNAKPQDSGSDGDNVIGSPCSCEGEDCSIGGVPTQTGGTILGCEDVSKDWSGGVLACLRSYEGDLPIHNYFANGFCSLFSMGCSGDEVICAVPQGDFEAMTSCPEGNVLLTTETDLIFGSLSAHIKFKYCAPACEQDSDCRIDEYDEVLDKPGQYQCMDKDGVKFCFDPRNLADDYLAEAF